MSNSFTVLEAFPDDIALGIARINPDKMSLFGTKEDDLIQIHGKRTTAAKCKKLQENKDKNIIRMDGLTRNNAAISIGDKVSINKIDSIPADRIILTPTEAIPPIDERHIADALDTLPVSIDDIVMIEYFDKKLSFRVTNLVPRKTVVINKNTIVELTNQGPTLIPKTAFVYRPDHSFVSFGMEDDIRKEDDSKVFLTMRFFLTHVSYSTNGLFEVKINPDVKTLPVLSKYKESAQNIVSSFNKRSPNVPPEKVSMDYSTKLLEEIKHQILYAWIKQK